MASPFGAGYYAGWAAAAGMLTDTGRAPGTGWAAASMLSPDQGTLGTDTPSPDEKARDEALDAREAYRHDHSDATAIRAENKFMEGKRRDVARAERDAPDAQHDERRARAKEHASGGSLAERRYGSEQPPAPPPVPPPTPGYVRAEPAAQPGTRVTHPPDPEASPPATPAATPAAQPAAQPEPNPWHPEGMPKSPTEWLDYYGKKLPAAGEGPQADEATRVMEDERKAAQQAGASVTGKPYVPTLDEALDNPISKPPPR